jgi:small GTP-binding protein
MVYPDNSLKKRRAKLTDIEGMYKKLPEETQEMLRAVWEMLPASEKGDLVTLANSLPTNANLVRSLVHLAANQVKLAFGDKHSVVIVGPANVGKSTLYNQFLQNKTDRAEVSPLPGTTRVNRNSDAGLFTIVDTPGADAVGEVGEHERQEALAAAGNADFLVIMFDAIQGIKQTELELYNRLLDLHKPYIVVLNKIDLVKRHQSQVTALAARNLNLQTEQIIPMAAANGQNLNRVMTAIALAEPGIVVALARALPEYRWQLAWRTIVSGASASAVIALTPLPVIDFIPLVAVQSVMILGIARIYNYEITPARARELIATFGLGFLARTIFNELSKFGGLPGWLLSAAVASSTTVAMGYAARIWFEKGEKVSSDTLNKITRSITSYLLDSLKNIGKRKPKSQNLEEAIRASLEKAQIEEIKLPNEPLSSNPEDAG